MTVGWESGWRRGEKKRRGEWFGRFVKCNECIDGMAWASVCVFIGVGMCILGVLEGSVEYGLRVLGVSMR